MESAKWCTCVLACFLCFTCLACSRTWCARVLSVVTCLMCFTWWRALWNRHAYVLGVLQKMMCSTFLIKWPAWRSSQNGMVGKLRKLLSWCVWPHWALLNARFWMRSDEINGRQEIAKAITKICLNFNFCTCL